MVLVQLPPGRRQGLTVHRWYLKYIVLWSSNFRRSQINRQRRYEDTWQLTVKFGNDLTKPLSPNKE